MSSLSKSQISINIRPRSTGRITLPPIPSSRGRDFNMQNQVYNKKIGNIFRVESGAMKQTMHSCIFPLTFIHPSTKEVNAGTAFLISQNIAMTSAHNLYDKNIDMYHQEVKLRPTLAGQAKHDYQISDFFVPEQFIMETQPRRTTLFDYAFLKLKEPVKLPGYLLPTINFNSGKQVLAIYGYPGRKYRKQEDIITVKQYGLLIQNEINEDDEDKELKRLRYIITTEEGQSGCPVVIGKGERNQVIAIHKGGNKQKQFNYGRLITRDMLLKLQIWRIQCRGAQFTCFDYSKGKVFNFGERYSDIISQIQLERAKRLALENQKDQLLRTSRHSKNIKNQEENARQDIVKTQQQEIVFPKADLFQMICLRICQLVDQPHDKEELRARNIINGKQVGRKNLYAAYKMPFWNRQTRSASQFDIYNKIVTKLYSNGMFQITSSKPVPSISKTKFTVHHYSRNIMLGLIKASKINIPSSGGQNTKGSIAYSTDYLKKKGIIIINGEVKVQDNNLFIEPPASITIEFKRDHRFVFFTTETKNYCYTLDEQCCNSEWYIIAGLKACGDKIQVM